MTKLPKAEQAVIAAHEAGMHDKKSSAECRECAREAQAVPFASPLIPAATPEQVKTRMQAAIGMPKTLPHRKPRLEPGEKVAIRAPRVEAKPKTKRVYTGKTTKTGDAELIVVPVEPVIVTDVPVQVPHEAGAILGEDITMCSECGAIGGHTRKCSANAKPIKPKPEVEPFVPETTVDRYDPALVPAGPSREAWLQAAVEHLRIDFTEAGFPIPEQVRVSVGWPGGRGKKSGVIGQCWPQSMATDSLHAIFISPVLTNPIKVLGVLVHELVHASVEKGAQHRGPFVKAGKHIGLTAPWTGTGESPALVERLTIIAGILGDYNHGGLTHLGRQQVQTTRMLKVECQDCGCVLRMTAKWINDAGLPTCGCGGTMEQPE